MIDILIPVLGRPQNAAKVAASIHAATKVPHMTVWLCSRHDTEQIEACKAERGIVIVCDDDRYNAKMNVGATHTLTRPRSDFVFMGADDVDYNPNWDHAAISKYEETGKPVIGTNDLGNPLVMRGQHATHILVHRSYIEQGTIDQPGLLVHEGYDHNWVDNEFIETAKSRDAWTFAFDSHVEHLHPIWRKGPMDVIYEKGRTHYQRDSALFYKRRRLWRERA